MLDRPGFMSMRARTIQAKWTQWTHVLRTYYHFTKHGFVIRRFDRRTGPRANSISPFSLWQNGYVRYPPAPPEILQAAQRMDGGVKFVIDDNTLPVIAYLIDLVRDDVKRYLGSEARVDDIYMNEIPRSSDAFKSVSGSWHTDNVGHRLKLFFCIEGNGDVPTGYRPGTNQRPYRPSIRQHKRFMGRNDFTRRADEIRLDHVTGSTILFDTNGEHRGIYDEQHGKRLVLLIEFSDRRKSDKLMNGLMIGPWRGFLLTKPIVRNHSRYLMLDPTLFAPENDNFYHYSRGT